jgi:hypothetical protein
MYVTFFAYAKKGSTQASKEKRTDETLMASVKGNPKPKPKAVTPPEKPTTGTPEKTNKK